MVPVHGMDAGLQNLAVFPPGSPPLGEWARRVRFRVVRALGALCREWVTAATTRSPRALLRRAHDGERTMDVPCVPASRATSRYPIGLKTLWVA